MVSSSLFFCIVPLLGSALAITRGYGNLLFRDDSRPGDKQIGDNDKVWRMGAALKWDDPSQIDSDEKLAGLARQGCWEMWSRREDNNFVMKTNFLPQVMYALRAPDNTVYMSSSGKGYPFFFGSRDDKDRVIQKDVCAGVQRAMKDCTAAKAVDGQPDTKHGNNAMCGEMYMLQAYCTSNPPTDEVPNPTDAIKNAQGVAVFCGFPQRLKNSMRFDTSTGQVRDYDIDNEAQIYGACDGTQQDKIDRAYGCKQVLDEFGIKYALTKDKGQGFTDPTVRPSSMQQTCILAPKS